MHKQNKLCNFIKRLEGIHILNQLINLNKMSYTNRMMMRVDDAKAIYF